MLPLHSSRLLTSIDRLPCPIIFLVYNSLFRLGSTLFTTLPQRDYSSKLNLPSQVSSRHSIIILISAILLEAYLCVTFVDRIIRVPLRLLLLDKYVDGELIHSHLERRQALQQAAYQPISAYIFVLAYCRLSHRACIADVSLAGNFFFLYMYFLTQNIKIVHHFLHNFRPLTHECDSHEFCGYPMCFLSCPPPPQISFSSCISLISYTPFLCFRFPSASF